MLVENFRQMAKYNQWMNTRLYDYASQLDPVLVNKDLGAFFGSILGTLNHLLIADVVWLQRMALHPAKFRSLDYLRSHAAPAELNQLLYTNLADLRVDRDQIDSALIAFIEELNDALLASALQYTDMQGNPYENHLAILLQHLFNHQTHHRGQISTLFNQCGVDIGVTDLMYLVRNN